MASLLAGARLVLRQGLRFLSPHGLRPAAVPVRCLSSSARFLTTAVQDKGTIDLEVAKLIQSTHSQSGGLALSEIEVTLKKTGRINKLIFLKTFEKVCKAGTPSSSQVWFLLQSCGSAMPGVPLEERTEIANTIWKKMKELGVVFDVSLYNILLKVYLENEHKFSPTEFLADMEAAQIQPNQATYEGMVAAYCNKGDLQGASQILGFMKSTNLPITAGVFSSLITGHGRSGDMESAEHILSVMTKSGIYPIRDTYCTLLSAFAEKGDIDGIKQTLMNCKLQLTDREFLKVIYSLDKGGHSQFVPDIFELMRSCTGYLNDVVNLSLKLLTHGSVDTALQVAKRFIPMHDPSRGFLQQLSCHLLSHCVDLDMPVTILKKCAYELGESNLHHSPLQFVLYCALQTDKKDLALELIRILKEDDIPIRPHYFWPLLASYQNDKNSQGILQVLKVMQEIGVKPNLETFMKYVADMFRNVESAESILKENGFQEDFNKLYLSALEESLSNKEFGLVLNFLSYKKIPIVKDAALIRMLWNACQPDYDVVFMAKITRLLYQDDSSLQKPSCETESVGYSLRSVIDGMSDSEVQERGEHLTRYFRHLMNMGLVTKSECPQKIIAEVSRPSRIPRTKTGGILDMEETLEMAGGSNEQFNMMLRNLLNALVEEENLEKVLALKSKHGSHFNFAMYMKVLGLCCKENNPKEAQKVKEEASQRYPSEIPTAAKYMGLATVLATNGFTDDAVNILREMQEIKVAVNQPDKFFAKFLQTLALKGDTDAVHKFHDLIVNLGLATPTHTLCAPLVMVHLIRKDFSAALDACVSCYKQYKCFPMDYLLLLNLISNGETELLKKAVDCVSSTSGERLMLFNLLFAFMELGKYDEAQKIAETPGLRAITKKLTWLYDRFQRLNKVEVLEKCVDITRSVYGFDREEMYFQLLCLYEKNNDWTMAAPLWYKMKEEGVQVLDKTAELFVNIFKNNGEDIYTHIAEFAYQPTEYESNEESKKVVHLCKTGKFQEAYNVFLLNKQQKESLSKTAYSRLIKALLEAGLLDNALEVEDVARYHFSDYTMRNVNCNLILEEQIRRDCLKDALVTVKRMLHDGNLANRLTLNKLTAAFAMKGDVDGLKDMEKITTSGDSAISKMDIQYFNTTLFAHMRNGNVEEATSMIESKLTENPNYSIYHMLLMLRKHNMSEELEKVSIVVERLCNQFSVYTPVTDLLFIYVHSGNVQEAKYLLERCSALLENKDLEKRIVGHVQSGRSTFVYKLLEVLDNPTYTQYLFSYMMKFYIMRKQLNNAVNLYARMKAKNVVPFENHLKQLAVLLKEADKPVPFPIPQSEQSSNEEQSFTFSPFENR